MNLTIQTSTNENLPLRPVKPAGLKIPGSEAWQAEGDFGTLLVEVFQSGPFTIRHIVFNFVKKMSVYLNAPETAICSRIATKNNWKFSIGSAGEMRLRENQFALFRVGNSKEKFYFEKGKEYRCFEASCEPQKLTGLTRLFPAFHDFLNDTDNRPSFLVKKANWAGPEIMDIVRELSECDYKDQMLNYYLEQRVDQFYFGLLRLAFQPTQDDLDPTDHEIESVKTAGKLILTDIKLHYSIPAIARRVHLNEFRLKYVFKQIYKMGVFEYLLTARMQEAKRLLLQTNKPIKEIASLTGYQRLTSFITAFRKNFGYTPGSVRRSREKLGSHLD